MFNALTFYASFDRTIEADYGSGELGVRTRFNHPSEKGKFIFEPGYDRRVFRISKDGAHGGALEAVDVLPSNGRIFFPAKGNLPYRAGGWSGSVSFWLKTDPDTMLKTSFCDPVQITQKGANNGGLWIDFPNTTPRDLRLGAFSSVDAGRRQHLESDPDAPLVVVKKVGFKSMEWHHVAFTWTNFDSGKADARAELYLDGRTAGSIERREITMAWDLENTGIYVAVSLIGMLDELAVFNRPLDAAEIARLHSEPGLLLRRSAR